MAFFLRRALTFGPIRFNLSKSGVGISAGITGARMGITSQGKAYLAGGRHGLYYRKNLTGGQRQADDRERSEGAYPEQGTLIREASGPRHSFSFVYNFLKVLIGIILLFFCLRLLMAQPALGMGVLFFLALAGVGYAWRGIQNKQRLRDYEQQIEEALVFAKHPPTPMELDQLKALRAAIHGRRRQRPRLTALEVAAYHDLVERVTEDETVTPPQAALVKAAEHLFAMPESEVTSIKRDLFVETYMGYIEDQIIEPGELQTLENYAARLEIPRVVVQPEIDTVNEILRAQRVAWPLSPLPREALDVNLFQSETPYYTADATVLWRKRDRSRPGGYRFDTWREGTLVMTERRFFVVGGGSTEVRYSEIGDIEVDLDTRLICVSKTTSRRPVYLEVAEPIYAGAVLEALNEAWRQENSH